MIDDDRAQGQPTAEPHEPHEPTGATPPHPGERRLERPPSDRYRTLAADGPATGTASPARGFMFGAVAAAAGVATIVLSGGVLAISAGLLIVTGAIGYAVANATMTGAGATMTPSRRVSVVVALAIAAVALGQVGLWLYARSEGGVLALPDYLGQVFGVLVPLQWVTAIAVGWWTAR